MRYVDAHCHLHEFSDKEIKKIFEAYPEMIIAAVSDDYESSLRTIKLYKEYEENIVPCVGVHPWEVGSVSYDELKKLIGLIDKNDFIKCLGEIGLDKKFVVETFEKQLDFFNKFVVLAREYSLTLNIHAAGAWKEVLDVLVRNDITKANFHWYTGSDEILREIVENQYYVSINPAVKIQEKHKKVAINIPLNNMLVESDGPYRYRGMLLTPYLIPEVYELISKWKNIPMESLVYTMYKNFVFLFK